MNPEIAGRGVIHGTGPSEVDFVPTGKADALEMLTRRVGQEMTTLTAQPCPDQVMSLDPLLRSKPVTQREWASRTGRRVMIGETFGFMTHDAGVVGFDMLDLL